MGDWSQAQDFNRVTICTASDESVGGELVAVSNLQTNGFAWPSANRAIFIPFVVSSPLTVARLFLAVEGSSGNVDVGIYDAAGHRIASTGSTAMTASVALQVFDIADIVLQAGVYYFAVAVDNTTATLDASNITALMCAAFGVLSQSSAFPLPDPATFAQAQDGYIPLFGLTTRAAG